MKSEKEIRDKLNELLNKRYDRLELAAVRPIIGVLEWVLEETQGSEQTP